MIEGHSTRRELYVTEMDRKAVGYNLFMKNVIVSVERKSGKMTRK